MTNHKPAIAIVSADTLAGIGLADIIRRMMPGADIHLFAKWEELNADEMVESYFHYFVSAGEVLSGATFFVRRQTKTIVLVRGSEAAHLPQGFHTLDVCQDEKSLVRSIISLAGRSHAAHGAEPEAVRKAKIGEEGNEKQNTPRLTSRECDVLRGIVDGLINKEIADRLGVSLSTVITHRKNLTDKLGTRSVSALTIYAVMHGISPCP